MDKFEQKMERASEELRESTRGATPPMTQPVPMVSRPRWLAFAAGFAVVLLAIGFLPTLLGGQNPPVGGPSPTQPPVTSAPQTPTTTGTQPQTECSATGVAVPDTWPFDDAPIEVTGRWHAITRLAVACDFEQLESVAGPNFSILFGAYGFEKFQEWEDDGEGQLGNLLRLLGTTPAIIEYPGAPEGTPAHYVWPAAFAYDNWEDVPRSLRDELLVLYTAAEMEEFFGGFGSYAGWRTAITEDGEWIYYTSGD